MYLKTLLVLFVVFALGWCSSRCIKTEGCLAATVLINNETAASPRQTVVTFVNGIYHSFDDCINISRNIAKIFGVGNGIDEIRPFYNPSTGNWISDVSTAGYITIIRPFDMGLAKELAFHLKKALKDVGSSGRVLHLAHSGGASLTYLAAKFHLSRKETSRIDVVTFGAGRSLTKKYFKGRLVNYYSKNDPLLLIDKRAGSLAKLTNETQPICEVKDLKYNTSFIFLRPQSQNPFIDHSMQGPTYIWALHLEAEEYGRRIKSLSSFQASQSFHIRRMRKYFARMTGFHHFWDSNWMESGADIVTSAIQSSAHILSSQIMSPKNTITETEILIPASIRNKTAPSSRMMAVPPSTAQNNLLKSTSSDQQYAQKQHPGHRGELRYLDEKSSNSLANNTCTMNNTKGIGNATDGENKWSWIWPSWLWPSQSTANVSKEFFSSADTPTALISSSGSQEQEAEPEASPSTVAVGSDATVALEAPQEQKERQRNPSFWPFFRSTSASESGPWSPALESHKNQSVPAHAGAVDELDEIAASVIEEKKTDDSYQSDKLVRMSYFPSWMGFFRSGHKSNP